MKPIVLIIRDGWGLSEQKFGNAIYKNAPFHESILNNYPHSVMATSGINVGLLPGGQGSSEVGHLNIGAGRIVKREIYLTSHL